MKSAARLTATVALLAMLATGSPERTQAASTGARVMTYALVSSPMAARGYDIAVEMTDLEGARLYDDPALAMREPSPTAGAACVVATREIRRSRMRTSVQEGICPGDAEGFVFNPTTMQARLAGEIPTVRWTRIWRVRGNRWALVTNTRRASTATADISWQALSSPQPRPTFCGFGPGLERSADANVSGSLRFDGLGLSVSLNGLRGELGWTVCGDADPY